jgi:hypothetical protein
MNSPQEAFRFVSRFNQGDWVLGRYGAVQPWPGKGKGWVNRMGFHPLEMPLFFTVATPIFIGGPTKKDARASERSPDFLSAFFYKALAVFITDARFSYK